MIQYEYEWTNIVGSGRRPTIGIVTTNHATKGLEHRLESQGTIKDRKDALSKGIVEPTNAVASARLRRSHQDDRRSRIDTAEQLKDPVTGRPRVSLVLHGHFQVDQGDMDLLAGDQIRGIPATSGLQAPHPHGVQEPRQFRRGNPFPPTA